MRWHRTDIHNATAYARTTLVRLNLNRSRKAGRERGALLRLLNQRPTTHEEITLPTLEPWLRTALARLSPQQRAAIVLVHVWGYSIAEAADQMECAPNTVKTHLARGMATLRAASTTDPTTRPGVHHAQ